MKLFSKKKSGATFGATDADAKSDEDGGKKSLWCALMGKKKPANNTTANFFGTQDKEDDDKKSGDINIVLKVRRDDNRGVLPQLVNKVVLSEEKQLVTATSGGKTAESVYTFDTDEFVAMTGGKDIVIDTMGPGGTGTDLSNMYQGFDAGAFDDDNSIATEHAIQGSYRLSLEAEKARREKQHRAEMADLQRKIDSLLAVPNAAGDDVAEDQETGGSSSS